MASLLLIIGPNLNLLGCREPTVSGTTSLSEIERILPGKAESPGHELALSRRTRSSRTAHLPLPNNSAVPR